MGDQVRFMEEHVLNNVGHDEGDKTSPVSQDFPVYITLTCNLVNIQVQTINYGISVDVEVD